MESRVVIGATDQQTFCKLVGLVVCLGKSGHLRPFYLGAVSYREQFGRYDR